MKKVLKIVECLFHAHNNEKVDYGGGTINVAESKVVTPALTVPARVGTKAPRITMSRAPMAVVDAKETYRDAEFVYGEITLDGQTYLWRTDGTSVVTNYKPSDAEGDDKYRCRRVALYPIVVYTEPTDVDMNSYRQKIADGTATETDAYRFSDAFYYGVAVNKKQDSIEVEFGADLPEVTVPADTTVTEQPKVEKSIMTWRSKSTESIPNDYSVESAMAGKYRLNVRFGVEKDDSEEGAEEYNLNDFIPSLATLEGYTDNPAFRSVLKRCCRQIENMFRSNGIDETKDEPVNDALKDAQRTGTRRNIRLDGVPGSGKSTVFRAVAAALGLPYVTLSFDTNSEKDELTAGLFQTEQGRWKKQYSWFARIIRHGGIVVLEDFTLANANMIFSVLKDLLEQPYRLQAGNVFIPRHPMAFIGATSNIGISVVQESAEPLITRFPLPEIVERLDDSAFKRTIVARAKQNTGIDLGAKTNKVLVDWIYDTFLSAVQTVKGFAAELADNVLTLRAAIGLMEVFIEDIYDGQKIDPAAEAIKAFANPLYEAGEAECKQVVETAIGSKSIVSLAAYAVNKKKGA